jgi:hypothetical protein
VISQKIERREPLSSSLHLVGLFSLPIEDLDRFDDNLRDGPLHVDGARFRFDGVAIFAVDDFTFDQDVRSLGRLAAY